jgi:hypothetical protein
MKNLIAALGLLAMTSCADTQEDNSGPEPEVVETLAFRVSPTINISGCEPAGAQELRDKLYLADNILRNSLPEYANTNPGLVVARGRATQRWFGNDDSVRSRRLQSARNMISMIERGGFQIYCNDGHASCGTGTAEPALARAQVFDGDKNTIRICQDFWSTDEWSTERATVLIHELAHFERSNFYDEYDRAICQNMAATNPEAALANAANHEYFYQEIAAAF